MDELRNFGSGPRELTGDVDLINHFKLLNHHDFFCKRSLPVSVSETHYLNNVVGDTEIRKGGEMQLNQLLQNSSLQRGTHARMQPFALNSLREAFQLKEAAPVDLPLVEKGISTFPKKKGSSKDKDSERKHMKHKIKDIDKEHKKHKHRHKDRTKDKHRYMDKKKIGRDSKKNHDSLSLGVGREGSFLFRNSFCSSFVSFWLSSFLPPVGMLPAVVDFRGGFRGILFAGLVDVGVVLFLVAADCSFGWGWVLGSDVLWLLWGCCGLGDDWLGFGWTTFAGAGVGFVVWCGVCRVWCDSGVAAEQCWVQRAIHDGGGMERRCGGAVLSGWVTRVMGTDDCPVCFRIFTRGLTLFETRLFVGWIDVLCSRWAL